MAYLPTTATKKLARLRKRIRLVPGGTSAGKTISIEQLLMDDAQTDTRPTLTSIVSESFPHLKRGAIRDFKDIMQSHGYWDDTRWNATDCVYTFETGSRIEFFSADQPAKVRGPRRDRLFVNEANNIPWETWDQLLIRTKEYAWADWNPTSEFWAYTELIGKRDDVEVCTLTYKDNEALDARVVAEIESHQANKNWWKVYGLGQLGETEAQIYRDWQIIDSVPHEARLERYGLDFGYSIDPTAIVAIYYHNDGYILDEITYQKGLSNKQIADIIGNVPKALVIADSAEPKSIDELKLYGVNVLPAQKGQGSVNQGIQHVQDRRISVTKRSINIIREYRNYLWKTDKDGHTVNVPDVGFDHAMDAVRYGMESLIPGPPLEVYIPPAIARRMEANRIT